jgi:hypothetical protein
MGYNYKLEQQMIAYNGIINLPCHQISNMDSEVIEWTRIHTKQTYNPRSLILIKNHVHHNLTKHIDIQQHYVRDIVVAKEIDFLILPNIKHVS